MKRMMVCAALALAGCEGVAPMQPQTAPIVQQTANVPSVQYQPVQPIQMQPRQPSPVFVPTFQPIQMPPMMNTQSPLTSAMIAPPTVTTCSPQYGGGVRCETR